MMVTEGKPSLMTIDPVGGTRSRRMVSVNTSEIEPSWSRNWISTVFHPSLPEESVHDRVVAIGIHASHASPRFRIRMSLTVSAAVPGAESIERVTEAPAATSSPESIVTVPVGGLLVQT